MLNNQNKLSHNERYLIDILFNQEQKSISEIAKTLKRSKSTISRELKRNTFDGCYDHNVAQEKTIRRRWHNHSMYLLKYEKFTDQFIQKFDKRYSGIKTTYYKLQNNTTKITWRQIYNWIKSNRWEIKRKDSLRQYYLKGRKRKKGIFSKFTNSLIIPIWARPKYIDNRQEFGHWEMDLIIGKREHGFENLITFQERQTRMVFIEKIQSKNPMKLNSKVYQLIKRNNLCVKSITIDNGIEFSKIGLLAKWLKCIVYFCEPFASYQRGSNEHVNGIIKKKKKKGTDFSLLSNNDILDTQNKINKMPREIFNWKSSYDVFNKINN